MRRGERTVAIVVFSFVGLLLIGFAVLPIAELAIWSFTTKAVSGACNMIGLRNFQKVLASNEAWRVLTQTILYAFFSVAMKLALGMCLALLAVRCVKDKSTFSIGWLLCLALIPWAIPTVASMLIWSWFLCDVGGVLNSILRLINSHSTGVAWLGSHNTATLCLITVNIWRGTGFFFAGIVAARLRIPRERYLVGQIEGASNIRMYRDITLPGLITTVAILTIISLTNTYADFQIVHILTNGGPGDSTHVLSTMIYEYSFRGRATLGYSSAFALSLAPPLIAMLAVLIRLMRKEDRHMHGIY
jgi:ABC-type sugar transport system permease subunit